MAARGRPSPRRAGVARGLVRAASADDVPEPHVLVILENVPLGVDVRVRKEVDDLLDAGYQVSVVTQSAPQNDELRSAPGLRLLEYPAPPPPRSLLGYLREYGVSFAWACVLSVRARARARIDVLQLIQPPDYYFPLAWLHKLLGAAVVVDQHDLMPELLALRGGRAERSLTGLLGWLERRTQRVADETICTNDYQKARLAGAGGRPERLTVVRNGPRLDHVDGAAPDQSYRDGRRFLCCWVGAMGRQDRVDLALQTADHVVHVLGRDDVRFVFLGDGECLEEVRAQVSQLGLDPWVSCPGWVPHQTVLAHLATAELGLDASLQEDVSPIKIYEYMAFGVPFVSFDVQETRSVGGSAGAYVTPGDVRALGEELVALLDDPRRRDRMGRLGQERVRGELAWEHQGARYLEVIARAAALSRRRRGATRTGPVSSRPSQRP